MKKQLNSKRKVYGPDTSKKILEASFLSEAKIGKVKVKSETRRECFKHLEKGLNGTHQGKK